ncbi:glycosyltransferase family 2 protein [Dyadobacter sandarakinus]|uniref:Glycosyltransferase family 2 protein n=1 Tax=Dyadobacter sandarakinus TaxID=2747268 RepID=A0ABX7ICY9_9BACT|nr:glycosyltransferase family 2 protein [Dyadobacter sandarakinus]QRR03327.1 glycosyltransferase family 2 protein [Dyadobacter sandarakinus]
MKISGFTIIRNAVINDYPIVEAITSILPVVDEMVVSVGRSDDDTLGLIRSIGSDKIRIVETEWDMSLREGGRVLAVETDKALQHVSPDTDWAFYIQGDEAVHEKYHDSILESCRRYKDNPEVEGLLFDYLHFYGTYDYVGDSRKWYRREIRIIRYEKTPAGTPISAYRDAQGFRRGGEKLKVKHSGAAVYHYGWVKSPVQMKTKMKNVSRFWHEDKAWEKILQSEDFFDYEEFDSLKVFEGTHPAVMQDRIGRQTWNVSFDISRKKFRLKDALLYWFEKKTGRRLFEFRNYRLI